MSKDRIQKVVNELWRLVGWLKLHSWPKLKSNYEIKLFFSPSEITVFVATCTETSSYLGSRSQMCLCLFTDFILLCGILWLRSGCLMSTVTKDLNEYLCLLSCNLMLTFVIRHVQHLVHGLWNVHLVLLCHSLFSRDKLSVYSASARVFTSASIHHHQFHFWTDSKIHHFLPSF